MQLGRWGGVQLGRWHLGLVPVFREVRGEAQGGTGGHCCRPSAAALATEKHAHLTNALLRLGAV